MRRDFLNQQLARASGAAAADLNVQINSVDASVKATTNALARVDDAVNKAVTSGLPVSYTSGTSAVDARLEQFERVAATVGTVGLVGLVAIIAVLIRSFRRRRPTGGISADDSMRLEDLQRAVDVIAVEVERISEAQRFMARQTAGEKRIVE